MEWSSSEYISTNTIYEDDETYVGHGIRIKDKLPIIIKVAGILYQGPQEVNRLKNAYTIGKRLHLKSILKPIALDESQGKYALILEDFNGKPLSYKKEYALSDFLKLGIKITSALTDLHANGIIHKNIKPKNILLNPDTGELKISELDLAITEENSQQVSSNPLIIEGSLPYMAPEQTGRTNNVIDTRSDLYSLGVTLYELYSGKLPYEAADPIEWVHAHLAKEPFPLEAISIPPPTIISKILRKLLSKAPEHRYQSSSGLKYDLEKCLKLLTPEGEIESFHIGEKDISNRFQVPHKLYGRENEIAQLISSFEDVVSQSKPILMLVSGYSGIGKTALIKELNIPITREKAFYINGKFDQFKREVPYSMISQAFQGLIQQIISGSEKDLKNWKQKIQHAIGANGQLIIDIVPEVEFLIGKQPEVQPLSLDESERRFKTVFRQFLRVFSQKEHPLILFLDDLQWADSPSLSLIEDVLSDPETHYLFIIGAYRDNEVNSSHPLIRLIDNIQGKESIVKHLILKSISRENVVELVTDCTHRPRNISLPLADLIYQKTAGNPFFTLQFLTSLYQEKLVWFDFKTLTWNWNLKAIQEKGYTDNVIDLMIRKIRKLSIQSQKTLSYAACIGNTFDVKFISQFLNTDDKNVKEELQEAVSLGLVNYTNEIYRFAHDRVQQATRTFLPESEQPIVHLKIGRLLLNEIPNEKINEQIFEIVNHLNIGASLLVSEKEKKHLSKLNLMAATKAQSAAAYEAAKIYAETGITLLDEKSWEENHELTFSLHLQRIQNEYLTKSFDLAENHIKVLLNQSLNLLELTRVYATAIQLQMNQVKANEAIKMVIDYLRLFHIDIPEHPKLDLVETEYQRVLAILGDRSIESLSTLPTVLDPEINALQEILAYSNAPAIITDEYLLALLACHGVRLSLEHGNSDNSSIHYSALAMAMGAFFENYQEGYRFGRLAVELAEKSKISPLQSVVFLNFGNLISNWVKPWDEGIYYIRKAIQSGTESGNITYACYSSNLLISALLAKGLRLNEVLKESNMSLEFIRKSHFLPQESAIFTNQLFIQKMQGRGSINEFALEQSILNTPWPIEICWFYIRKLQAHTIFGEFEDALKNSEKIKKLLWTTPYFIQTADFTFYYAIALSQLGFLDETKQHEEKLKVWSNNCPTNFADRAFLVSAERARLEGNEILAQKLYEKAIIAAKKSGFIHNEALAYEIAAKFYAQNEYQTIARSYIQEAYNCYLSWGADAKTKQLLRIYPEIIAKRTDEISGTFAAEISELDLLSVIKSSQVISGEIKLFRLIEKLMTLLIEHSGANSGKLILNENDQLQIVASAELDGQINVKLLPSLPVANSNLVPERIIQYTKHFKKNVILQDAAIDIGSFKEEKYFLEKNPRSVLCFPINLQSRLVGILYLENTLTSGVFTKERIKILEILASQSAISLKNAELLKREHSAKEEANLVAKVSSLLAESLELDIVIQNLAKLIVHELGDWCEFDLIENNQIYRHAGAHKNPSKFLLLEELAEKYPPQIDSPHPSAQVLRTKKPFILTNIQDKDINNYCVDNYHSNLIQRLGTRSVISLPMQSRGEILGVLTIGSNTPFFYSKSILNLGLEIVHRTAVAIENTILYRQAQEAIKLRETFITVASHELRTPISALKLQIQLILRFIHDGQILASGDKGKDLNFMISKSLQYTNQIIRLIEIMFDTAQFKTKSIHLEKKEVNLKNLFIEVIELLKFELETSKCTLTLEGKDGIVGHWDPVRIKQVITNLLNNAMKYGAGKPIKILVEEETSHVKFLIEDKGIGIAKADQGRIFNIFERAVNFNDVSGLGLGLFISKQIVEAHHGQIWFKSEQGKGSIFYVKLPLNGHG